MPLPTFAPAVENTPQGILLPDSSAFHPDQTLDCGQAFRWEKQPDGSYRGAAGKRYCEITQQGGFLLLGGITEEDFDGFWRGYFDLDRDYGAILESFRRDPLLARAVDFAPGIRVLRQDSWEALCSFIISQNNNIPRIKGIISRLCGGWGAELQNGWHAFPEAKTLAALTPADLAPLRAGFRARYLIDAAQKVASGEVVLEDLAVMPLEEARNSLRRITGVGVKVAECTLLYGCGRVECFPMDVWMKRAMETLFPNGLPACARPWAGIAQQFIFHYARHHIKPSAARD